MSASSGDPAQMLTYLNAASDSIHRVGTQTVRGVATTRYHVVLDLFKVAAQAPAAQQAAVRRTFAHEVKLLGTHTMPIDVWIDSSGLVRREQIAIPLKAPSIPAGASMAMTSTCTTSASRCTSRRRPRPTSPTSPTSFRLRRRRKARPRR